MGLQICSESARKVGLGTHNVNLNTQLRNCLLSCECNSTVDVTRPPAMNPRGTRSSRSSSASSDCDCKKWRLRCSKGAAFLPWQLQFSASGIGTLHKYSKTDQKAAECIPNLRKSCSNAMARSSSAISLRLRQVARSRTIADYQSTTIMGL